MHVDTNTKFVHEATKIGTGYFLAVAYTFSIIITGIVYLTGGTSNVYSNLMYLPIAVAATTKGKKQGVLHAVISALLIGPFMPMNVSLNQSQPFGNWLIRLLLYAIIALIIGFFADYQKQDFERNLRKDRELLDAQMATIYSLVKLSESRDIKTAFHVERVSALCKLLAEQLQTRPNYQETISDDYIENISMASALHDIGKVGISDQILLKPGKLTPEEFEIMKTHTTLGTNTLKEVHRRFPGNDFLKLGISITHYHHERWDGSGYPEGLAGTKIPLAARIVAVADVYDALRSERVYKTAYSHEKALAIIREGRGSHFDPNIISVFLENGNAFKTVFESFKN